MVFSVANRDSANTKRCERIGKTVERGINVPYWESDHVLNIAYNVLTDGKSLEDIERLRNDTTYMNGLGAEAPWATKNRSRV